MQWINENDLTTWAKRLDAKTRLADLVADLIMATIEDPTRFRFPGGDFGQVRGFDGDLDVSQGKGFVPQGKSKWEFGVTAGKAKAEDDYEKRCKVPEPLREENTLVLVNLYTWDAPRDDLAVWIEQKKNENRWQDVKYIDGVTLIHWLDAHPAVAARYARDVLQSTPQVGAISTDEFWTEFSLSFTPPLTEEVVLCGRKAEAEKLLTQLSGSAQLIMLGAATSKEVVAFAVATIRSAGAAQRRFLENRTLIIESVEAARFLSQKTNLIFVTTKKGDDLAGMLSTKGVTVSAATGIQARNHPFLARPNASDMAAAFTSMEIPLADGYELAHRCARSLVILRRQRPNGPFAPPEWEGDALNFIPAFLAGGWVSNTEMDKKILCELSGIDDYEEFEKTLRPSLRYADPPFDRVEEVWQVRAPVDAFPLYGAQISASELKRLRECAIKVFSHIMDPPSRDQKFSFSYTAPADYSKWLREGLALTLLLFAAMPALGGLSMVGQSPQNYVDSILRELPGLGSEHRSLSALAGQASLLAEAAPIPFLSALESMLQGHPSEIQSLFVPRGDDFFAPASPHIPIQWALEALAWEPKHLRRVGLILAQFAEFDSTAESKLVNRPIDSLRSILVSWAPSTFAVLGQRLECIDAILEQCEDVGWSLLMRLMPVSQDFITPTQRPKLRDPSPLTPEGISFGTVWDTEAALVERALVHCQSSHERVLQLVEHVMRVQPQSRTKLLHVIDEHLEQNSSPLGNPVWHFLREQFALHQSMVATEWALRGEELEKVSAVVVKHQPTDVVALECSLFDDWLPSLPLEGNEPDEDTARISSLRRIWEHEGAAGVMRLLGMAKVPELVFQSLAVIELNEDELVEVLRVAVSAAPPNGNAILRLSAIGAERFPENWEKTFTEKFMPLLSSPSNISIALLGWPIGERTWQYVESLGVEVKNSYWTKLGFLPQSLSEDELLKAVAELQAVGRSTAAIAYLNKRVEQVPGPAMLLLLDQSFKEIANNTIATPPAFSHFLTLAFAALEANQQVSIQDIALREFKFLPLIENGGRTLALHRHLATDPKLYVQLISRIFNEDAPTEIGEINAATAATAATVASEGDDNAVVDVSAAEEPPDISKPSSDAISAAYQVLSSMHILPGQDGEEIDGNVLTAWVSSARRYGADARRIAITELYIGHVLAHAPKDTKTGFWPPLEVVRVIETAKSAELERGVDIERSNMRGTYSKELYEGGEQERALAKQSREWATRLTGAPRTSDMLRRMGDSWDARADAADKSAELQKLKH